MTIKMVSVMAEKLLHPDFSNMKETVFCYYL